MYNSSRKNLENSVKPTEFALNSPLRENDRQGRSYSCPESIDAHSSENYTINIISSKFIYIFIYYILNPLRIFIS